MNKYSFHTLMTASLTLKMREVCPMDSDSEHGDETSSYKISEIVIPKIQRDYAQGRGGDAEDIRESFVESLYDALSDSDETAKCSLNFIYGQLRGREGSQKVSFVPLDGQQRLTTLFLLHWYLTRLTERSEEFPYLSSFRYETRFSSAEFTTMFLKDIASLRLSEDDVEWLKKDENWLKDTKSNPVVGDIVPIGRFEDWIRNKPKFSDTWCDDPTIAGMIKMLEAIHAKFRDADCPVFLKKLTSENAEECPVYFFFKQIDPTTDDGELFIKMNSRGKLLTEYEYFKADFQRLMKRAGVSDSDREDVARKMDVKWEPSFWRLVSKHGQEVRLESSDLDTQMMRLVNFAIDALGFSYRNISTDGDNEILFNTQCPNSSKYERKRLERFLLNEDRKIVEERFVAFLDFLDVWTSEGEEGCPGYDFFKETFCEHDSQEAGKIAVFGEKTHCQMLLSIFASHETMLTSEPAVLFFASTLARILKLNKLDAESRLRSVRNLLWKMDRQLSDMHYVYRHVRELMKSGAIKASEQSELGSRTFPVDQIREETFKLSITTRDSAFMSEMRRLEESQWFMGSISALLPDCYYDKEDLSTVASVFMARKSSFERLFGSLDSKARVPDAKMRDVLFWVKRCPYCIPASNSWYHWGTRSGDFRWRGDTRPFFSRNISCVRNALLAILDGDALNTLMKQHPELQGESLLNALADELRKTDLETESGKYNVSYYMTNYYDLFFEPWSNEYSMNEGRMKVAYDDDGSFRDIDFYSGKNRSKPYWDPYLYVMWKLSGMGDKVSGIVNHQGTEGGSRAYFISQDIYVYNHVKSLDIQGSQEQLEVLRKQYPSLSSKELEGRPGLFLATLGIPQCATDKNADAEDRVQFGVKLFKLIDTLPVAPKPPDIMS